MDGLPNFSFQEGSTAKVFQARASGSWLHFLCSHINICFGHKICVLSDEMSYGVVRIDSRDFRFGREYVVWPSTVCENQLEEGENER